MNVAGILTRTARRIPNAPAVRFGDHTLTYREFDARVSRLAQGISSFGVERGGRVAILMRNRPELLETLFACFRLGCVAVPLNVRLHPNEIAYIVGNAGCTAIVLGPEFVESVSKLRLPGTIPIGERYESLLAGMDGELDDAEVADDDLAWLFYTSGTTGRPKGAMLSHRNLTSMVVACLADVTPYAEGDITLHAAPLTHGAGLYALPAFARGSCQIIYDGPRFDPPEILRRVQEQRITTISFLTPTMVAMILNHPEQSLFDTSSLKAVVYGGAPMYAEDMARALRRFGPIFTQIYGQGEAPMTISFLPASQHSAGSALLESAGVPHTEVEVRIVDENDRPVAVGVSGEVCARGPVVMRGYWNDPEATANTLRDGWLHTGDVGRFDEHGYLYLLDRKKDVIISGGNNVYPREVEEVLLKHPAVQETAVIGVPDRLWGESVHAAVVLRPGQHVTAEELIAFCREHIATYKKPRSVEFVSELPKSAYGKVLRRELRERYWTGQGRRI